MAGVVCVVVERVLDRENRALDDLPARSAASPPPAARTCASCGNPCASSRPQSPASTSGRRQWTCSSFSSGRRARRPADHQRRIDIWCALLLSAPSCRRPRATRFCRRSRRRRRRRRLLLPGARALFRRPPPDRVARLPLARPDASAAQARRSARSRSRGSPVDVVIEKLPPHRASRRPARRDREARASAHAGGGDMSPRAVTQANLDVTGCGHRRAATSTSSKDITDRMTSCSLWGGRWQRGRAALEGRFAGLEIV